MVRNTLMMSCLMLVAFTLGCGQSQKGSPPDTKGAKSEDKNLGPTEEGKKYLLAAEPKGAKGVVDARKDVKDGEPVVLVGRIAGSRKPFVDGRASFSVTDLKIEPCAEDEGCPTPWDCCCTGKEELLPAMAQVKFDGKDGKTLNVGAKELLGVKELAIVVVTGKANRDDKGNLTVVADGLHVRSAK